MHGMTVVVERALARISRPLVIAWTGIDREPLRMSWRAAAIRRAARLRGAYRDLDPQSVPGRTICVDLHRGLGVDPKNPLAGDVLLTRALTSERGFEPESGAELASAFALELLVPIAFGWSEGHPQRVDVRFGRDGEQLDGGTRGDEARPSLRARAVVCRDGKPWSIPAWCAGRDDDFGSRDLMLVAFLATHDCGDVRVRNVVRLGEELIRARATAFDLAAVDSVHRQ